MEIIFDGRWEVVIVRSVKNGLAGFANDHSDKGMFFRWYGRMPREIEEAFQAETVAKIREREDRLMEEKYED